MYYCINGIYSLRGWKDLEAALVTIPTGKVTALSHDEFLTLLLCDGETIIDESKYPFFHECIDAFIEKNIVDRTESASPISDIQRYRYFDNKYVGKFFWSITGKCNYRCKHCYMDAPNGKFGEFTTEEALKLIDEIKECGGSEVCLTGGEPFIRKDFWRIVDYLSANNIHIQQVYTNGRLLDEHAINEFEKRGIKPEISISFDGIGWHDWLRGSKGAEKAAIDAWISETNGDVYDEKFYCQDSRYQYQDHASLSRCTG